MKNFECKDYMGGKKGILWTISQIYKMINNNDLKEKICFNS